MEPLLHFYRSVDLEAAAVQAAVLEEVTYVKVLGVGAKQTYAKAKGAAKWLAGVAGIKNEIDDRPAKSTAELVVERSQYWLGRSCEAVHTSVLSTLASRLQTDASDLGVLSTRLIEEAAAGYGISADLLLSQQAEAIAIRYMTECIEGLQEQLKKQGDDEIKVTEGIMAKQLASLTPAERLEIQKALNLQTLSASSLRSVFMKSGVPVAGIAAVQVGGFGSYLALTTIMHAVFTSMLGITLPFAAYTTATSALSLATGPIGVMVSLSVGVLGYFWGQRKIERSQYAMIVWTCVGSAARPLVPITESLPSGRRLKMRLSSGAPLRSGQAHPLLTNGSETNFDTPTDEAEDFQALEQELATKALAAASLSGAQRSVDSSDDHIRTLKERERRHEGQIASLISKAAADSSLQESLKLLLKAEVQARASVSDDLQRALLENAALKDKLKNKETESALAESAYVKRLERRTNELKALWRVHFPRFDFRQQPLRWATEQDFAGRIEIERALKELADAPDPVKLSRSKMHATQEHHSRFTIPKGVECRLFFVVEKGRVDVRRLCKKKDM